MPRRCHSAAASAKAACAASSSASGFEAAAYALQGADRLQRDEADPGDLQRLAVEGEGRGRIGGIEAQFAETVARLGLAEPVVALLEHRKRLMQQAGRLLEASARVRDLAPAEQGLGHPLAVAVRLEDRVGAVHELLGLRQIPGRQAQPADAPQRHPLALAEAELPVDLQLPREHFVGLPIPAGRGVDRAEQAEGDAFAAPDPERGVPGQRPVGQVGGLGEPAAEMQAVGQVDQRVGRAEPVAGLLVELRGPAQHRGRRVPLPGDPLDPTQLDQGVGLADPIADLPVQLPGLLERVERRGGLAALLPGPAHVVQGVGAPDGITGLRVQLPGAFQVFEAGDLAADLVGEPAELPQRIGLVPRQSEPARLVRRPPVQLQGLRRRRVPLQIRGRSRGQGQPPGGVGRADGGEDVLPLRAHPAQRLLGVVEPREEHRGLGGLGAGALTPGEAAVRGPGGREVVVHQPVAGGLPLGRRILFGERAGVVAQQVVQLVAAGGGLGQQVVVQQRFEHSGGGGSVESAQVRRGPQVEVRAGDQAQAAEDALLVLIQPGVGAFEQGGQVAFVVAQPGQPALGGAQFGDQVRDGQRPVVAKARAHDAQGQRDLAAQGDQLADQVGGGVGRVGAGRRLGLVRDVLGLVRDAAGTGGLAEQVERVAIRQDVHRQQMRVVEPGHDPPAGDQDETAGRFRQQRPHLRAAGGVVQHDQGPGPGQPGAVQRGALVRVRGDRGRRHVEGAQQVAERVLRRHRLQARGIAAQVHEELAVREPAGQPVRGVHGQRGLADAGHPVDGGDDHHAQVAARRRLLGQRQQLGELGRPAGEEAGVRRELIDRGAVDRRGCSGGGARARFGGAGLGIGVRKLPGQDPLVYLLQRRSRFDAEPVYQRSVYGLEHSQRFGGASAAGQREHQGAVEGLGQRMVADQAAQLRNQLVARAQLQLGLDTALQGLHPQLLQPRQPLVGQRPARQVGQRLTAPQAQCRPVPPRRLGPATVARGLPTGDAVLGEDLHVQFARRQLDQIARRHRPDPLPALGETLPQPGHLVVQRGGRRGRLLVAPQVLHQPISRHDRVRMQQQRGQQRPSQGPADLGRPRPVVDPDRAQQLEPHALTPHRAGF